MANERAGATLFNDIEESQRKVWTDAFEQQASAGSTQEWPNGSCWNMPIPKTDMLLTDDAAGPIEFQKSMLGSVKDDTWSTTKLDSGERDSLHTHASLGEDCLLTCAAEQATNHSSPTLKILYGCWSSRRSGRAMREVDAPSNALLVQSSSSSRRSRNENETRMKLLGA